MTILQRTHRNLFRQAFPSSPRLVYAKGFGSTASLQAKNRIYDNIRTPNELDDLLLLTASTRTPLITLWTASWCPSCKHISPLLRSLLEVQNATSTSTTGNKDGVSYAEIEFDSPTLRDSGVAARYAINSIPTLMAFQRQEAQMGTRLTDVNEMRDRDFLELWIRGEVLKGSGGGGFGGSFGGGGDGRGGGGVSMGSMFGIGR